MCFMIHYHYLTDGQSEHFAFPSEIGDVLFLAFLLLAMRDGKLATA